MAGLGFKDFQVGEVLTSSDVDGYLMQQTVMRFADAGARGSALGTATGTAVPLAEGMVTYLDSTNTVQMYDGTGWVGIGNFSASTAITATDATWSVPTLADPVVRVVVIGGGGGGGASGGGSSGGTSSFACAAGTATALGGPGGVGGEANSNGSDSRDGFTAGNGGGGASYNQVSRSGCNGLGGEVEVVYLDMTGISTANVTIGAGGAGNGGSGTFLRSGGDGGDGSVIFEYRAA